MTQINRAVRALAALGFTDLEARCWAFLVKKGPCTGYAVAQGIARPAANTYQALAALEDKGAAVSVSADPTSTTTRGKSFRALPAEALLGQLERSFQERKQTAVDALRYLVADDEDDRVWSLSSPGVVIERFHALVADAREVVLAVVFPGLIEQVRDVLEAAADRGVDVVVKGYQPFAMRGVTRVLSNAGGDQLPRFGGQELVVVVDGQATLFALLGDDGASVVQAISTRSTFVALMNHNGLACELAYTDLLARVTPAERERSLTELRHPFDTPGHRALLARMPSSSTSTSPMAAKKKPAKKSKSSPTKQA